MVWAAVANLVWGAWSVLGPVIADRDLGGAAAWGVILGALGVGALFGAVAAIRRTLRPPDARGRLTRASSACRRSCCSPWARRWR